MEYRTVDTNNKDMSKKEKDFYKAMQRYYGLDRVRKRAKIKRIEEALLNGEDVSKLLEGD